MTALETVARAIYYASDKQRLVAGDPYAGDPVGQGFAIREARAALQALREPTEEMLNASPIVGTGPDKNGDWAINTQPSQDCWRAMIDAALKE